MKKMFVTVVMAAVVVLAVMPTASKADAPPGVNKIGFYTSADAAGICNIDAALYAPTTVYMCLTGCSFGSNGIQAWEATITGMDGVIVSSTDLLGGQNFGTPPTYIVGTPAIPTPNADGFLVLAVFSVLATQTDTPIYFGLTPIEIPSIEGHMALANGVDEMDLQPADPTNGYGVACFGINSGPLTPPVAVDEATWGGVKNLYR